MKATNNFKQNILRIAKAGLVSFGLIFSSIAYSESVALAVAEQGNQAVQTPSNGQKKEYVEAQFGAPIERVSAVGEPPISKWVYQNFTVYFEHDTVLHAVLHKS